MNMVRKIILILIAFTLAACGGGGGGSSTPAPVTPAAKTTAILTISTKEVAASGVQFSGVGFTLTLPKGVTVVTDSNNNAAASVAIPSGVALDRAVTVTYTAAENATLDLLVAGLIGNNKAFFGIGEFVTVTLKLPAGNTLAVSDFTEAMVSKWSAVDGNLANVPGVSPSISVKLN